MLVAPILEESTNSREVYFPTVNWTNLYSGKVYLPGRSIIDNISLTDRVPIFLKAGYSVMMQEVGSVRNTKDLSNIFELRSSFVLTNESEGVMTYISVGSLLSLG